MATSEKKKKKNNPDRHVHFDEMTIEKSKNDEAKRPLGKKKPEKPQEDDGGETQTESPKSRTKALNDDIKKTWLDNIANKEKQFKTGKFSQDEMQKLMKSICEYVSNNNLGKEGLINLVSKKASKETFGAWSKISLCLPQRTVQSCHNVCKRKFNPNNYKGKWTKEEEQRLIELVEDIGRKWELIAEELGRTAGNVRDKFKSLGEENHQSRIKDSWSLKELFSLLKYVQRRVGKVFLKEGIEDLLNEEGEFNDLYETNSGSLGLKRKRRDVLDDQLRKLSYYINFPVAKEIDFSNINWTKIAKKMKTKSKDDCRNKWFLHIHNFISSRTNYEEDEDRELLRQIADQGVESDSEIDFNKLDNSRPVKENQLRWQMLKKYVSHRGHQNTTDVIKLLHSYFEDRKKDRLCTPSKNTHTEESNELFKLYEEFYND